jgi:ABC-type oligopeptide transport system substrate-binding subunit
VYPSTGEPGDAELLDPAYVGRPLPFIKRIEYRLDKEQIPRFGKFLQGYYDASLVVTERGGGIVPESFDQVVQNGEIAPAMAARGMRLRKSVSPATYYIGFNMTDATVGHAAGERGRKLRQAMSLVIDFREFSRLFLNGSGIPAEQLVPPGIFGYDAEYRNPYRSANAERARALLAEAGYPGGIDPATSRPLKLGLDTSDTRTDAMLKYEFFTDSWRTLGIDVEIRATTFNQFQDKVRKGGYQIFYWGWFADYPDPENFLAILESSNSRTKSGGENTANFADPRYDALFAEMETRPNDARRAELVGAMRTLVQEERPIIELYHDEIYALYHPWLRNVKAFGMSFPMWKYADVDPAQRAELREQWNEPVTWPAYALAGLFLAIVLPGVRTFLRERQ